MGHSLVFSMTYYKKGYIVRDKKQMNVNDKLVLAKCICLLYNESVLPNNGGENSVELVRAAVSMIKVSEVGIGINGERDIIASLRDLVVSMCEHYSSGYDEYDILQRIRLCCGDNDKLYEAIKDGIHNSHDASKAKRYVISAVKYLTNLNKEYQFYTELNNAMNQFRFKRETIKDFNSFVGELLLKLEPLQLDVKGEDPAIMGSISLTDETKMVGMFKELRERDTGTKIYRTGWQGINEMLQGGFRPGDTVIVAALPHQNKTGFTIALCKHLVVYNKPLNEDPNKKPLILRISFEDKLNDNLQSMYQNIYFNEHGCMPDLTASEEEMSQYIKAALSANGFYIEMIRVDPSQWTYKNIMSKVLEYETMGYVVEALMLDYLAMIPTTGCVQGPAGVDVRDLFRRMRNFCAARNTVLITPHQLSTDAKNLLRLGVSDELFVKELTGRGYFAGSKQLDQEADVILFIHRVENKKTGIWYQAVQLEKHRLPTVVSSDKKFLLLPFPKVGPIPDDLFRERIDIKRLAHASGIMAPEDFLD